MHTKEDLQEEINDINEMNERYHNQMNDEINNIEIQKMLQHILMKFKTIQILVMQ